MALLLAGCAHARNDLAVLEEDDALGLSALLVQPGTVAAPYIVVVQIVNCSSESHNVYRPLGAGAVSLTFYDRAGAPLGGAVLRGGSRAGPGGSRKTRVRRTIRI